MTKKSALFSVIILLLALLLTQHFTVTHIPAENGTLHPFFCQVDDCAAAMRNAIKNASDIKCAFYDLKDEPLEDTLRKKGASVLVFEKNYAGFGKRVPASHGGLMHDKFCVLDAGKPGASVITGSTNPTINGFEKNDNNLVIIEGAYLAENYLDEWEELEGEHPEHAVAHPRIIQREGNNSFLIENYFCPEDACEEKVLRTVSSAKEQIFFLTFSFTSDAIGEELLEKARRGVEVKGVFEKREENRYSEHDKLEAAGLDVRFDGNKATMHHKVFIIDPATSNATVITGSYNPTKSGNTRNDENLLIIHNKGVAEEYMKEFWRVWRATETNRTHQESIPSSAS